MSNLIIELTLIMSLVLSFIFIAPDGVSANHHRKSVTPYGDSCDRVNHYGVHKKMLDIKRVKEALKHYYAQKSLDIEILNSSGRFIKTIVKDKDKVVDTIIFDRKTGRIRSIY